MCRLLCVVGCELFVMYGLLLWVVFRCLFVVRCVLCVVCARLLLVVGRWLFVVCCSFVFHGVWRLVVFFCVLFGVAIGCLLFVCVVCVVCRVLCVVFGLLFRCCSFVACLLFVVRYMLVVVCRFDVWRAFCVGVFWLLALVGGCLWFSVFGVVVCLLLLVVACCCC